jgi:ribosomal protein L3 glutamine methyltransferase
MATAQRRAPATVGSLIRSVAAELAAGRVYFGHGTTTPRDEAAALIYHVLGLDHAEPQAYERAVDGEAVARIQQLVAERIRTRRPLPYLLGEAWFAGLPFFVDERVLIPRSPFAELLTGALYTWVEPELVRRVLEIGTGCGCIAIAAARAFPEATIVATDISAEALVVARRNVERHGLTSRISLLAGDLYADAVGPFDVILSNPPYVPEGELATLPPEYGHEPRVAFAAGADGLELPARIVAEAPAYLAPDGVLAMEVGGGQDALEQRFPRVPFLWPEFRHGGDGIAIVRRSELADGLSCR